MIIIMSAAFLTPQANYHQARCGFPNMTQIFKFFSPHIFSYISLFSSPFLSLFHFFLISTQISSDIIKES